MVCALCQINSSLRNSHIIPEFLYDTLYDDKHRLHQLSTNPDAKDHLLQKGVREPLLCEPCEQRLSVLERYVSLVLNGGVGLMYHRAGKRLLLEGLDYTKFKLFQLSVLWRASISSLPMFTQVSLGSHEDRIRQMLLRDDPGPPERYGCLMFVLLHEGQLVRDLIVQPTWARLVGHYAYRFVFGGMVWVYVVSGHELPSYIIENFIQPTGKCIIRLQDMEELTFLIKTVAELHQLGKLWPSAA
jgi:hypothetical protein